MKNFVLAFIVVACHQWGVIKDLQAQAGACHKASQSAPLVFVLADGRNVS